MRIEFDEDLYPRAEAAGVEAPDLLSPQLTARVALIGHPS